MTGNDFLQQLKHTEINESSVKTIEIKYNCRLPMFIQEIISASQECIFLDNDWRILSVKEILDAPEDLHVDFVELRILPLIDTGENNFIVYCLEKEDWSKFNIIDECFFKNKRTLDDYF